MRFLRPIITLLALAGLFVLGFWIARSIYQKKDKVKTEEDATVLLEKIQTVAKLVTVEGYFSELYNYKDYYAYDWWIFRKKAILRVKAKVSAGYDLSGLAFDVQPEQNLIVIRNIPDTPQIISIDHQLDYYDISEGTFNSFSETDYNKINKNAKTFIEEKARQSDLLPKAKEQGIEMLELIRFMAESAGWKVQMDRFQEPVKSSEVTKQLSN
ncbi:MAG: DUF4230 domain-containing protein [Haliscomenobacter sp.]|nr:DUF4230 domain-containing protein [Haliscomenobacter sp.]